MGVHDATIDRECVLLIGGDTYPGYFEQLFARGDIKPIFGDLLKELRSADLTIVNLECPLTDCDAPIRKNGPCLRAHPDCVKGLSAAGIDAVTLANNHIGDYGETGVVQTLDGLKEAGIRSFGAGKGVREAGQVAVFELGGLRLGLLGMAENEFSIAGSESWGANPIDLIQHVMLLSELRASSQPLDHLVILLHGGNELYPYPSPWLQRLCRFLIEQGATAVICQHFHVAGTYELYDGGLIVYGQGNFVFGRDTRSHSPEGFLVRLALSNHPKLMRFELVPYLRIDRGVRRMTVGEQSRFEQDIGTRNKALESEDVLYEYWRRFAVSQQHRYLSILTGQSRVVRSLVHRLRLSDQWYRKYDVRGSLNYIRCESHREALVTLLEMMFGGRL